MIKSAFQYHNESSYDRDKMSGQPLDWQNQPRVFKEYQGVDEIPMPMEELPMPGKTISSILTGNISPSHSIDLKEVSSSLQLGYGLTAKAKSSGGEFYFRSSASAGALYPTEIYLASRRVQDLNDGLYHYKVHRHSLTPLRTEDTSVHVSKILRQPDLGSLTFFLTAIYFRSAWKYKNRAYRYHLLDTGHVMENLTLALKSLDHPYEIHYDFDDQEADRLLGIDPDKESTLAVVRVLTDKKQFEESSDQTPSLPETYQQQSIVSEAEIDYPEIREMHSAGVNFTLPNKRSIDIPQEIVRETESIAKAAEIFTPPSFWLEAMPFPQAIFHRRSKRNFIRTPVTRNKIDALIDAVTITDIPGQSSAIDCKGLIQTGFFIEFSNEMESGFYLFDQTSISKASSGSFMEKMTHVCLDQGWLMNASMHFLFMANIDSIEKTWGPRGYRYAMLHAGRLGQRLYLVSTAMGLGCCGIGAFYDLEASKLLSLNESSRLLYLVSVGSVKRM